MHLPGGKKGLLASAAVIGAVVYWRVRKDRLEAEREWAEDVEAAIDEGIAAARANAPERPV